ncbi:glycosyltransferase family 10 (fucosyltransferase) c-term domain-containing protein [Ditylenchus destructor]|nr:glycosyltransferase family 10 (fucosyltransferase) c-term domain-containing protein [Ditylenchus destructor]
MMRTLVLGNEGLYTGPANGLAIAPFKEDQCPYKCNYTDDKTEENINKAAMIIYHIWINGSEFNSTNVPPPNPERLNVFFQSESVLRTNRDLPQDFFNITMTYSPNSDIYLPYDVFEAIDESTKTEDVWSDHEVSKILAQKSKLVLIGVSHCNAPSGRDDYVRELSKYVTVTQFGACSGIPCPSELDVTDHIYNGSCVQKSMEDHMFYLALENTICEHYITEKFWHLKELIVPIVLTRRILQNHSIPDDSYIATDDFSSVKELADYLLKLQKDQDEYRK